MQVEGWGLYGVISDNPFRTCETIEKAWGLWGDRVGGKRSSFLPTRFRVFIISIDYLF